MFVFVEKSEQDVKTSLPGVNTHTSLFVYNVWMGNVSRTLTHFVCTSCTHIHTDMHRHLQAHSLTHTHLPMSTHLVRCCPLTVLYWWMVADVVRSGTPATLYVKFYLNPPGLLDSMYAIFLSTIIFVEYYTCIPACSICEINGSAPGHDFVIYVNIYDTSNMRDIWGISNTYNFVCSILVAVAVFGQNTHWKQSLKFDASCLCFVHCIIAKRKFTWKSCLFA